jgi:signal transduction histidine kinase
MTDHHPQPTLGHSATFLLRRTLLATYAAALLIATLVTTVGLVMFRVVVMRLWALVSGIARAAGRHVRRRTSPSAPPPDDDRDEWESAIFRRWLPTAHTGILLALRQAAQTERHEIGRFRGTTIPAAYRPAPDGGTQPSAAEMLRDPATWRDLAYWAVGVPLIYASACVVAVAWLAPLGLIAVPLITRWSIAAQIDDSARRASSVAEATFIDLWSSLSTADSVLIVSLALAIALIAPALTRGVAIVHAVVGETLLSPGGHARLRVELDEQRARRRLAVEAAETERRRIERDLHDGAQQRLVSLAMSLGMARQKFETDPAGAQQLVADAHAEAKLALGELRSLARGIHPAVLTDRGLDAALSALAGRVGVPVDVEVTLARRPPTAVESAAYFVVAEALTNVTRHAAATRASVRVLETDGMVVVEITDDGVGGADPAHGTGLAGLRERIDSMEGSLEVRSLLGGPTVIRAELPCAS